MIRRREKGLHQAPSTVPDNGPTGQRYRSFRSQLMTHLFVGVLLGTLLMIAGDELDDDDQSQDYMPDALSFPFAIDDLGPKISMLIEEPTHESEPTPRTDRPDLVEVCTSDFCNNLSSEVQSKMDSTIASCDDFYGYACRGFMNSIDDLDGKNVVNAFSKVNDLLQEQLLATVSANIDPNEIMPFKVAKSFYQQCMDKTKIERQGKSPLVDNLVALGGWPVLKGDEWTEMHGKWSWEKFMMDLRVQGFSIGYLFDLSIGENLTDPSRSIIYVDQPSLGISREDLVQGKENGNVSAYHDSMIKTAQFLGAENEERADSDLRDSLQFEIDLARITLPDEERRNASAMYNPISVKDFKRRYPDTDWVDYFNTMLGQKHVAEYIDENETIIVRAPMFMKELFPLLQRTPNHTIADYVMWRIIRSSSSFLPEQLRNMVFSAEKNKDNRTKECLDITIERLPFAVEALYSKIYINDSSTRDALDTMNEIKNGLANVLKKADWIDSIKINTLRKMVFKTGLNGESMNDNELNEYYKGLESIPKDNLLDTVRSIDYFSTTKRFEKFRQPFEKISTYVDPTGVTLHYSSLKNSLRIERHYLNSSFFLPNWPRYMNYGVMGSLLGRWIIGSFIDQGWHWDNIGNSADRCQRGIAFLNWTFYIIKQFENKETIDYSTIAEKVVDTAGIQMAYHAYRNWATIYADELLPDLNLTFHQLFWLSAAQTWCSVHRLKVTNGCYSVRTDRFRVIETMRNMAEFSTDFKCPSGSNMRSVKAFNFW